MEDTGPSNAERMTENKRLVRRYLEEVVNTHDLTRIADFVAAPDVEHSRQHLCDVRSTFPDLVVTVEEQFADGDRVISKVTGRATHKGELWGIPPTNKPVVIEAVNIDRVRDGKIVEHWGAANMLEALLAADAFPGLRKR